MVKKGNSERLKARDWERATLDAIAEEGLKALSIPKLAKRLGVTKGSFYWHFDSLSALLVAALQRWERSYTDRRIEKFEEKNSSFADGVKVWSSEAELDHKAQALYLEISNAAASQKDFADVVSRVIEKRVAFIEKALKQQGVSAKIARRRSVICYTGYVGMLHLTRVAPETIGGQRERSETVREMASLLGID